MSTPLDGLKQIAEYVHPRTLKRLRDAGAVDPKGPVALVRALPWLIGRGPTLAVALQMHAMVLKHKPAVVDRNGTLTWAELNTRTNQAAHALEELGVQPNDRVALLLRNGREMSEIALGAQRVGMVACPLNTWAKPKELKATLAQADPTVLIYDTAHSEQVEKCAPEDLDLVFVGDESKAVKGSIAYEELMERQSRSLPPPFTRNRGTAKVIIHTSGTTGTPKGASRAASQAGMGQLANLLGRVPYRRDDIVFCPAPLFHSFGLATFTIATALGSTMILPEKFDAEESLRLIEEHRATAASFVPVMIRRIVSLDDDVKSKYDVSSLRIVMASGSVLGEELRRQAAKLFGDVLYDLYGSTEIGWVAIATPEDMATNPKTVGKPVEGIEIAVFNKEGEKVPTGETGELYVKSDILFEGYTSGESKDEREGYMAIGDLGHIDDDDYLFVESRADDMVVVGGENVYPIEIERVIDDMEGVEESAVLGIEDEEYGQVLAAFVAGSVDASQIEKVCKEELASYKVPKRIEILDELPRTSTGKVIKRELIENLKGAEPLDEDGGGDGDGDGEGKE